MTNSIMKQELIEQRELLQNDIQCILDGMDNRYINRVCDAIVDRFNLLIKKGSTNPNLFDKELPETD